MRWSAKVSPFKREVPQRLLAFAPAKPHLLYRRPGFLPPRRTPEEDIPMSQTRFRAGDRVQVTRAAFGGPSGSCSVVSALPRDAGPQQYRVRSDGETFERIIDEARLEAMNYER